MIMKDEGLGLYPIHDPEMPEVVEALQAHIERLGNTYAHDADLDPVEGANRISQASDLFQRLTESLALLKDSRRVPPYSDEARRAMLLKQVADWERIQKGGR